MIEQLQNWIEENRLNATIDSTETFVTIEDVGKFLILRNKYFQLLRQKDTEQHIEVSKSEYESLNDSEKIEKILGDDFELLLSDKEYTLASEVDYLLFKFGERFYYSDTIATPALHEFKYVGKIKTILQQQDIPFLGIHGGYDLCNGSRRYEDWCRKAKFLGITTLGLAEENTLAGVLPFQKACEKYNIKSIIGETIVVQGSEGIYRIKLYCRDKERGWKSLLAINKVINVSSKGIITEEELLNYTEGLICLLTPEVSLSQVFHKFENSGFELYYQFDTTEWSSHNKEEEVLQNLQEYLDDYLDKLLPVLVSDAFYLDQQDNHIRKVLHKIGHVGFRNQSKFQYFKCIDDYAEEITELIPDVDRSLELLDILVDTTIDVFRDMSFKLITGSIYFPKYVMTEEESSRFTNNEELLWNYIYKGLEEKVIKKGLDKQKYLNKVEDELRVIKMGGFIDYFLILADIYRFCDENDIWYGIGRGSAPGATTLYLTGVTGIDPFRFSLLFERFLNEGRVSKGGTAPDVDCDIATSGRPRVKQYIEERYGREQVVSIGTFGTFKLRNALKDIGRIFGVDSQTINYISPLLPDPEQQQPQPYNDIFLASVGRDRNSKQVKDFVQKYHKVVEMLPLCLNQPKNNSIHAAGVVIAPKEYGTAAEQIPIKEQDGILATEWEGSFVEEAGLLKLDILGLQQLDKLSSIYKLIKEQTGESVHYKNIDLDDKEVFELFKQGYNEDVFQLGAIGLKNYCKQLQPETIEDLIVTVALYRPGPIESGTHIKYIKRKNGEEEIESDPGCEEITQNTYGLIVYQEQVMQICQRVADFSLVEADDIRKALGKMKPEIVKGYRDTFLERSTKKGYNRLQMESLWSKMEAFAAYAFNKSHSAAYAITGYYCQWYKVHYPLQFWTISLQYSSTDKKGKDQRTERVNEIFKTSKIHVKSVDINYSQIDFTSDVSTNAIYWGMFSVKWVGEKTVDSIITEREENGLFFSLEEFYLRVKGKPGINIRAIAHLIIAGAFDNVCRLSLVEERYRLVTEFYTLAKQPLKEEYEVMKEWFEHEWVLEQKKLTGFGIVDFKSLVSQNETFLQKSFKYKDNQQLLHFIEPTNPPKEYLVAGLLTEIKERKSKNGVFAQLAISDNTDTVFVTMWSDTYVVYKEQLQQSIGKVILLNGNLQLDTYKNQNVIYTTNQSKVEII